MGDGWLVSSATPQEIKDGHDVLFETAEQYDREIEEDQVGVLLGYDIALDVEGVTAKAHKFVTWHRPDACFTEY